MFTEGFLNYFSKQLIYFSICFCKIYKKKSYLQNNFSLHTFAMDSDYSAIGGGCVTNETFFKRNI